MDNRNARDEIILIWKDAYRDGLNGKSKDIWQQLGEETIESFLATGKTLTPGSRKFIQFFAKACLEAWELGNLKREQTKANT